VFSVVVAAGKRGIDGLVLLKPWWCGLADRIAGDRDDDEVAVCWPDHYLMTDELEATRN
jgi:hypothetical protein